MNKQVKEKTKAIEKVKKLPTSESSIDYPLNVAAEIEWLSISVNDLAKMCTTLNEPISEVLRLISTATKKISEKFQQIIEINQEQEILELDKK